MNHDYDTDMPESFSTDDYINDALKLRNLSEANLSLATSLSSTKSTEISLTAIRLGNAGLTKRRQNMLDRVPEPGQYASFEKGSIEIIDLAYLSAQEGHEFALIRGKKNDILMHGTATGCDFDSDFEDAFMNGKMELIAHSHPDMDKIIPSKEDREFLKKINQKTSIIISWYTGRQIEFSTDEFE